MLSTHGSSSSSELSAEISSKQGVALCVVAAFFLLVEVLVVVFSRVVHQFTVGVVGFDANEQINKDQISDRKKSLFVRTQQMNTQKNM